MIPGGVLISVPLATYGDHKVSVSGNVASEGRLLFGFDQVIQGPAPLYTRIVNLAPGSHRLEVVVKDLTVNKIATDSITFEVK